MKRLLFVAALIVFMTASIVPDSLAQQREGPAKAPHRGGTLREISANGPRVLSYPPEMGPGEGQAVLPAAEKLMEYNRDKELVPFLAESVNVAKDGKSITFKLRKGVKFHDGSDLNAEAVAWNYQLAKDSKTLQYNDKLTRVEVVDNLTVRLHITRYTNQLIYSYGWVPLFSKQAWDKAGGGNVEKSKEWARTNIVGTGPFKLAEYKRDSYIKWVKNENYWQPGQPFLDGIYVRYVPDPVTASAMLQANEADLWYGASLKELPELEKKGFLSIAYGLPRILYFNTKDASSVFQNRKLREAVEYALDKPAIAKALGFGYYTPLTTVAPPGEWGYDQSYKGRTYDPAKATQLLAEAGYPSGVKVKLLAMTAPPWPDEVQAIKRYLDEVGIVVEPDMADAGRFFQSLWLKGWQDMALFLCGRSANGLVNFHRQFGPEPMSNYASFKRPPDLVALAEKSLTLTNSSEQRETTRQLIRMMSDEALVIPLYLAPIVIVHRPWVHTNWLKIQMVTRYTGEEWIDSH
jgi:peptide/nickel transport system substrate-binding protein